MDKLSALYNKVYGIYPQNIERLAGAGSNRRYYRLTGTKATVIGTVATNLKENRAFFALADYFATKDLPVPEVIAVDDDEMHYLQTDLGDTSLFSLIARHGLDSHDVDTQIEKSMNMLARVHAAGHGFNTEVCFPRQAMDKRAVMWDLNYFKYCFAKPSGAAYDEDALENAFGHLANLVLDEKPEVLLLRDFQSRNIFIHNGEPYMIDFQGARRGPALYDVASFLWQSRIGMPDDMKFVMARKYADYMRQYGTPLPSNWENNLRLMALFRMLQVLGAYGFRGLFEHKTEFITSIPQALENSLALLCELNIKELDPVKALISSAIRQDRFQKRAAGNRLKIKVYSFSYKKGIPEDFSGNGGGFVFDCRAIHNPGRYDLYKPLTGRDKAVVEFLEADREILPFLENCYGLVDASVEKYLKRGFTSLTVSFGCTGGRHRSVYSAEHMARHLAEKYDVDVQLIHREQGITENLYHICRQ